MRNKIKGNKGEAQAVKYLEELGYELVEQNYRSGHAEIDIIALWDNRILVFTEVKVRTNSQFGDAETFVNPRQEERICKAAEEYIYAINWQKDIRFDIIAIDREGRIEHFEDAFY